MPIHFIHVGKTGGTAVKFALGPYAEKYDILLHPHATKLADLPMDRDFFFFIRNPVTRFVSSFNSRLRKGRPRYNFEWLPEEALAFRRFPTPNSLGEALSDDNAGTRLQAIEAMRGIQHVNTTYGEWFKSFEEIEERGDKLLLIGSKEEMELDFERMKRILKLPAEVQLPKNPVYAHITPPELDAHVSETAVANLEKWYARDMAFYEKCLALRQKLLDNYAARDPEFP